MLQNYDREANLLLCSFTRTTKHYAACFTLLAGAWTAVDHLEKQEAPVRLVGIKQLNRCQKLTIYALSMSFCKNYTCDPT
jgi:hypothetical protein